ncbi:hypothetical protein GCM10009411_34180 [Shewanella litoralis]|uniref:Uncharacterized protein n=1 Tax=Shewanella litoralis TaxID=2282700 RepID=A0ABQ2RHR5_9GAMM|nr:hypothetical protein GCM10009411_34180 [Shewanella litoralis]
MVKSPLIYSYCNASYWRGLLISTIASDDNPFAIPVAAVIGIPLYIRAEAVIPLSAALAGWVRLWH